MNTWAGNLPGWLLTAALNASTATFYVDVNGTNATSPYADWSTAATNIQEAIDAFYRVGVQ